MAARLPVGRCGLAGAAWCDQGRRRRRGNRKLTGSLLDRGLAVDALAPDPGMLAVLRRVLRPDGWLGLLWNTPVPVEQWELELAGIDPDGTAGSDLDAPGLPSAPEATASFPWTWEVTPDQWCSYLATNSGVAAMPQAERAQHLDAARAVVARVCEATGRSTAPVRHRAVCFRWRPS